MTTNPRSMGRGRGFLCVAPGHSALNHVPPKQSRLTHRKITARAVLDRGVVPHEDVMVLPSMRVGRSLLLGVFLEGPQQLASFILRHSFDRACPVQVDIERRGSGNRVCPHDRMYDIDQSLIRPFRGKTGWEHTVVVVAVQHA